MRHPNSGGTILAGHFQAGGATANSRRSLARALTLGSKTLVRVQLKGRVLAPVQADLKHCYSRKICGRSVGECEEAMVGSATVGVKRTIRWGV